MRKELCAILLAMTLVGLVGCDRPGRADVELTCYSSLNSPGVAVEIDPGVSVSKNEVKRTHGGMDVEQVIVVHGPVRIVPAVRQ